MSRPLPRLKPGRMRLLESDNGWCLRANRVCARQSALRYFAAVSRLGDGVFWYVLMGALVAFDGMAGLRASLHLAATGLIASEWFEQPTQRLDVLAVTGTNGKTSTAWWLAEALNLLSKNELTAQGGCALVGTLGIGTPPALASTGMKPEQLIAFAFQELAGKADKIGQLNISPDLLRELLDRKVGK